MWQSGGTSDAIFGEHAAVAFLCLSRSRRRRLRRCLNKVDSFRKASDNNLHGLPYAKCLSLAARRLPTMGRAARHTSYPSPYSILPLPRPCCDLCQLSALSLCFVCAQWPAKMADDALILVLGCTWIASTPPSHSFASPFHPHSFVALLVMVAGEWVALRSVHVAYNFIHHTSKKKKKILRRFESNRQQSFFPCFSSLFLLYSCFTLSCRGYMHFVQVFVVAPG